MERDTNLNGLDRLADGAFDVACVRRPIGPQREAVAAARTVVDAAPLPAVRRAGSDTVGVRSAEIGALSSWPSEWCGAEPESAMGGMTMPGGAVGRGAGEAVAERALLAGMLRRRNDATGMGELALERASHPVLMAQARAIMAHQSSGQETFGRWLAPWRPGGAGTQMDVHDGRDGAANGDESAPGAPRRADGDGGGGV